MDTTIANVKHHCIILRGQLLSSVYYNVMLLKCTLPGRPTSCLPEITRWVILIQWDGNQFLIRYR